MLFGWMKPLRRTSFKPVGGQWKDQRTRSQLALYAKNMKLQHCLLSLQTTHDSGGNLQTGYL